MSRHDRVARRLLGLVLLAGSLTGALEGGAAPAGTAPAAAVAQSLPAPQWVGGTEAGGKAQLTWIRSSSFAAVRVYRRDDLPQSPFLLLGETGENVWVDTKVQPGRTYRYRLAGLGKDGLEGRASSELAVRIGIVVQRPPVPPLWEGYLVLEDGVGLKWSVREGEDVIAWNIYRKTPPETEFRLIGSTRGNSYRDVGLEPGRPYLYVLTALDSNFLETPFSKELSVKLAPVQEAPEPQRLAPAWVVRRTRLVSLLGGGGGLPFLRPADVAVGPVSGQVYVTDSGRNLVFVFSSQGAFQGTLGRNLAGDGIFKNLLGLAIGRDESLHLVDAGAGVVQTISSRGHHGRRVEFPEGESGVTGLIDAAVGPTGLLYVVDNYGGKVAVVASDSAKRTFGTPGAKAGEFSAPTFCAVDAAGYLYVADCLNARVQVFTGTGEFVRAFGRSGRGPGAFGRPKGVAVSAAGEVYVADSWLNTIQVFDAEGRFVAILGDENGRPLDLGSPNGVALGPGNRVYVAERLAARLQILEIIDAP